MYNFSFITENKSERMDISMKKFSISLLLILLLLLNLTMISPLAQVSGIKEGLYKASDLKLEPDKTYTIQNASSDDSVYLIVFNEDNVVQQYLKLEPKSQSYSLFPTKPDYRIVIVGNGDVNIS